MVFRHPEPFALESGVALPELEIHYQTHGTPNAAQDNVVWVCHALTGNADVHEWWDGLIGAGRLFDPARHFIVCANVLGSCYGTTGANSRCPTTGQPYRTDFPDVTIRDMARAHQLLRCHLELEHIWFGIGGSLGGQQLLEWAVLEPQVFDHLCPIATNAQHSAWGIAFNEAQRMALDSDPTLADPDHPERGHRGLEAARSIAMLSYRNYATYQSTQHEPDTEKLDNFRAVTYQRYQGRKLRERFDVDCYRTLSRAMDSHNLGRGRGGNETALRSITAKTLVVGIQSDLLFPVPEQVFLAAHLPDARLEIIESMYGHDGFLIEYAQLEEKIRAFLSDLPAPVRARHEARRVGMPGSEVF